MTKDWYQAGRDFREQHKDLDLIELRKLFPSWSSFPHPNDELMFIRGVYGVGEK